MKTNKKIMKKNSYFISINYKHGIYNKIKNIPNSQLKTTRAFFYLFNIA